MPSAKSQERIKAEQMYRESNGNIKLVEIAEHLGLPPSKVRKWKSIDKWEYGVSSSKGSKKKQVERSTCAKGNAPQKTFLNVTKIETMNETEGLTEKQLLFCQYFVRSLNKTQSYMKAYGCSYATANTEGPALLTNPRIREEIKRLKEIKHKELFLDGDDVVDLHMRIAFADITDFVEFRNLKVPEIHNGEVVQIKNPKTGDDVMVSINRNEVYFKSSDEVDGALLMEVSQGKDGAKVKLADRQRSLAFLERYFELNPYDNRRLAIEEKKAGGDVSNEIVDDWLDGVEDWGADDE